LKQRILTGAIAGAAFLGLLAVGGNWFAALIVLMAIIGFDEYVRMNKLKDHRITWLVGMIALILLTLPWEMHRFTYELNEVGLIWGAAFVLMAATVLSKNKITIDMVSLLFLGVVYIGVGFHYMIMTRWIPEHGLFWTLLIFVSIWATDSGAYFVGSKFGKHLLWPVISPKKSVEGALGGILIAIVAALCFSLARPELLSPARAVLIGVVIAVSGQLGDLMQSAYKRVKGIKDTGTILPGHGGILDRVDSWLIVFPLVHWLALIPS